MATSSTEVKRKFELISPALQEIIRTRSSGKTPALFALRYLTRQIIQKHAALNTTINTGGDSSHLSMEDEQEKLKIIGQLSSLYAAKLAKLGGVEGVLDTLQAYIVGVIKKLDPLYSDPTNNPKHRAFREEEASQEIGIYKTALRALLDSNTLGWSSTLHKGSKAIYAGILFRQLLALYWLAASDDTMSMDYENTTPPAIEKERKEKLEFAKRNFVIVISEIRRAHNEPGWNGGVGTLNNPIDNPSCPMGAFGRIVSSSVIFNKAAYFMDINKSDELINQIMLFVKNQFMNCTPQQKILIGRCISDDTILMIETSEKHRNAVLDFINRLTSPSLLNALIEHLRNTTHDFKFLFKLKYGVSPQDIHALLFDILKVHLKTLLSPNDYAPDATLTNTILGESFKIAVIEGLGKEGLKTHLERLRQHCFNVALKLRVLREQLIHELIAKPILVDQPTAGSDTAKKLKEEIAKLNQENDVFHEIIFNEMQLDALSVMTKLIEDGGLPCISDETREKINLKEILKEVIQYFVPSTSRTRMEENRLSFVQLQKLLEESKERSDYISSLPYLRGDDKVQAYASDPSSWARYYIALAQKKHDNVETNSISGSLGVLRTCDQQLMEDTLKTLEFLTLDKRTAILCEISRLLEKNTIRVELERVKPGNIEALIEMLLHKYPGLFPLPAPVKDHVNILDVYQELQTLFPSSIMENIKHAAAGKLCHMYVPGPDKMPKDKEEYQAIDGAFENMILWSTTADTVLKSSTNVKEQIHRISCFVALTVFQNLNISHFPKMNLEGLVELCQYYLVPDYALDLDDEPINVPKDTPVNKRITLLLNHLIKVFSSLRGLEAQFLAGNIVLMTSDRATKLLAPHSDAAFERNGIVRINFSMPHTLRCDYFAKIMKRSMMRRHLLEPSITLYSSPIEGNKRVAIVLSEGEVLVSDTMIDEEILLSFVNKIALNKSLGSDISFLEAAGKPCLSTSRQFFQNQELIIAPTLCETRLGKYFVTGPSSQEENSLNTIIPVHFPIEDAKLQQEFLTTTNVLEMAIRIKHLAEAAEELSEAASLSSGTPILLMTKAKAKPGTLSSSNSTPAALSAATSSTPTAPSSSTSSSSTAMPSSSSSSSSSSKLLTPLRNTLGQIDIQLQQARMARREASETEKRVQKTLIRSQRLRGLLEEISKESGYKR